MGRILDGFGAFFIGFGMLCMGAMSMGGTLVIPILTKGKILDAIVMGFGAISAASISSYYSYYMDRNRNDICYIVCWVIGCLGLLIWVFMPHKGIVECIVGIICLITGLVIGKKIRRWCE